MDSDLNTPPPADTVMGPEGILLDSSFNDPVSNMVLKSSDDVFFRVEDHYLKSNR
jgi:hypothetical protein